MRVSHLGYESLRTYRKAEKRLRKGRSVTFIGLGPSMEPIIPHGTRMWWEPYRGQPIVAGMPLFTHFGKKHYSCHMAWMVSKTHVLICTTQGYVEGWVRKNQILGLYLGEWKND